jgi:hypothetical protein
MGAALNIKILHSSNPKFYLILLKIRFLARPHPNGKDPFPVTYVKVP